MLQEQQEVARQAQHEVERQAQQEAARQASNTHRSPIVYVPPEQPPLWLVRDSKMVRDYIDIAKIRSEWANRRVIHLEHMLRRATTEEEYNNIQQEIRRAQQVAVYMQHISDTAQVSALDQYEKVVRDNEAMIATLAARAAATTPARESARAAARKPFVLSNKPVA